MARIARVIARGYPHHIMQRGHRRRPAFSSDDDYRAYLALAAEWCAKCRVTIWAWCLMPNHVHLVAVPRDAKGLARAIGEVHRRYARLVNSRKGRRGCLWQGRFASSAMDVRHALAAARYIERNPVRAGLVKRAWQWRWSSAAAHVRGRDDALAKVGPLLAEVRRWRQFLATDEDEPMRELIRLYTRTGRPLGDEGFLRRLERRLGRVLRPQKPGRKPKKK